MSDWIDGMDPRKSETLALTQLGSTQDPQILDASFDYGWRSLRPFDGTIEHFQYKLLPTFNQAT